MPGMLLYVDEILFDFTVEELVFPDFYWIYYRGGWA